MYGGGAPLYIVGGSPLYIYMGGGGSPLYMLTCSIGGGVRTPTPGGECTQQNSYRYLVLSIGTDALTLHGHSQY